MILPLHLNLSQAAAQEETLEQAARAIAGGGIVAYPTETFYGLAVDPRQPAAIARLFAVKGRPAGSAVPLIAADVDQVHSISRGWNATAARLASEFWPGPLTLVLHASDLLAPNLLAGGTTVAVRVPAHAVARALAGATGHAVTSTSANRTSLPPIVRAADVIASFGERIDLVLDAGPTPGGLPSTIVDVSEGGAKLVRAGVIAWDRVLKSLGNDA